MAHRLAALLLVVGVSSNACRTAKHAAPIPSQSSTANYNGQVAEVTRETADFSSCSSLTVPSKEEEDYGRDTDIECALGGGLIAQQSGSACFNVNRLLDSAREPLFESELETEGGFVFVVDAQFEVYRCNNRPIAVAQSGEYFANGPSTTNSCHGERATRRAFTIQDIGKKRRYDGLSSAEARARLLQVTQQSSCDSTNVSLR